MLDRPLERSELLSIAEKDEDYYNKWVGNDFQELAQRWLGVRTWVRYRNALTVLSRFGYFISSNPTPGEEFCEAEATSVNPLRRLITTLLNNELNLGISRHHIEIIKDINLITFLLLGDYYELPKRVTNYFYRTGELIQHESKRMSYSYKFIALMSIIRLFLKISKSSSETGVSDNSQNQSSGNRQRVKLEGSKLGQHQLSSSSSSICQLCSEATMDPTSTICGHVFCWQCIHNWLRETRECPICRTPTEPSRLIYLINFA